MDTPGPQLQVGRQEQELRQLLNKDKSKRSKDGGLPGLVSLAWPWARGGGGGSHAGLGLPVLAGLCL